MNNISRKLLLNQQRNKQKDPFKTNSYFYIVHHGWWCASIRLNTNSNFLQHSSKSTELQAILLFLLVSTKHKILMCRLECLVPFVIIPLTLLLNNTCSRASVKFLMTSHLFRMFPSSMHVYALAMEQCIYAFTELLHKETLEQRSSQGVGSFSMLLWGQLKATS